MITPQSPHLQSIIPGSGFNLWMWWGSRPPRLGCALCPVTLLCFTVALSLQSLTRSLWRSPQPPAQLSAALAVVFSLFPGFSSRGLVTARPRRLLRSRGPCRPEPASAHEPGSFSFRKPSRRLLRGSPHTQLFQPPPVARERWQQCLQQATLPSCARVCRQCLWLHDFHGLSRGQPPALSVQISCLSFPFALGLFLSQPGVIRGD